MLAGSNAYLMVGHVAVTAIDPERPASHSKRVIDDLIRSKWGFQGIIVTDDLVMGAIYQHDVCTAVVEALNAGVDLLLVAYDGVQYYRLFDCALNATSAGTAGSSHAAAECRPAGSTTSEPSGECLGKRPHGIRTWPRSSIDGKGAALSYPRQHSPLRTG